MSVACVFKAPGRVRETCCCTVGYQLANTYVGLCTSWKELRAHLIDIGRVLYCCSDTVADGRASVKRIRERREKYEAGNFETYVVLKLFKNKKYVYEIGGVGYEKFSNGEWNVKNGVLCINSKINAGSVPVSIVYDGPVDTVRWRNLTNVQVPVNLKGKRYGDSRIYVNDTLTYYFPFFDTCIGSYRSMDSIRIDFGSDFKSQWVPVKQKSFKQLKVVIDEEIDLYDYLSFINRRYRMSGSILYLIE